MADDEPKVKSIDEAIASLAEDSHKKLHPEDSHEMEVTIGDTAPSEGADTPTPTPLEGAEETPEFDESDYIIGESNAYGSLPGMGKQAKQQESGKNKGSYSGSGGATPPERKHGGGGGGKGNSVMEVIWNEMVIPFYTGCIDKAVDLSLDFVEWVLYMPFKGNSGGETKPKKHKNTVFDVADELVEKKNKEIDDLKPAIKEAHEELIENVKKHNRGEAVTWQVWESEPEFFEEFTKIAAKAENPNAPEARVWEHIQKGPEIIEDKLEKEKTIRSMSIYLAALKLSLEKPDSKTLTENMETKAEEYYQQITENIEKIREKNKDNPAQAKTETCAYLRQIKEFVETGKDAVYAYLEQGNWDKIKENWSQRQAGSDINIFAGSGVAPMTAAQRAAMDENLIHGSSSTPTDDRAEPENVPTSEIKTKKAKAVEGIAAAEGSVNKYKLNGEEIGSVSAPRESYETLSGKDKTAILSTFYAGMRRR